MTSTSQNVSITATIYSTVFNQLTSPFHDDLDVDRFLHEYTYNLPSQSQILPIVYLIATFEPQNLLHFSLSLFSRDLH